MTTLTTVSKPKRIPVAMNGVDTPALFATIGAVGAQPELAQFQFRAHSRWISGTARALARRGRARGNRAR
jgi:hypothetical protein